MIFDLSFEAQIVIVALVVLLVPGFYFFRWLYRRVPRKLNVSKYTERWSELQAMCKQKEEWAQAIERADLLFDKALKTRRFKGKSMGERIVSAQKKLSDNDGIWQAHNLAKKLREQPDKSLKEKEVKDALVSFRQALRDLGALEDGNKK